MPSLSNNPSTPRPPTSEAKLVSRQPSREHPWDGSTLVNGLKWREQETVLSRNGSKEHVWNLSFRRGQTDCKKSKDALKMLVDHSCKKTIATISHLFICISVGTATGYGLDAAGSILGRERFFSSPPYPDQLWVHPDSYTYGYSGRIPQGKSGRNVTPPYKSVYLIKHRDHFTLLTK
jgi:hypothetical protein